MTGFCSRSVRSVVTITLLVTGVVALAQDSKHAGVESTFDKAEQSDQYIDEIVVVGSRRRELLQEVGLAISAIDPNEFVTVGLVTLEDAISYTAGVHFQGEGNWGYGTVFMRAATQESATPVTAIYIDDIPLTPEVPYAWSQILMFDGMLGDVERVEFIKGPQGTLYGAGAVGGVIRYVTRDPSMDNASGRISVDVSNTAHGEWNERYKLQGSIPVIEDKLAVSATGVYSNQSGFLDRTEPASGSIIKQNINSFELAAASLTGLWRISDNISLKVLGSRYESDIDHVLQDVNYDYPSFEPTYGNYITESPPSPATISFNTYAATLNVDFDWASLTYVAALAGYDNSTEFDATPEFGELIDGLVGAPPGTNLLPVKVQVEADKRTQELRLASDSNNTIEWLAGTYFTDVDSRNFQTGFGVPSGYRLFLWDTPSKYRELAVYGNLTWFLRPNLDFTVGARHSDFEVSVFNQSAGFFYTGDSDGEIFYAGETDRRVTTYLLGARWRPSSKSSFYLRLGNGYRPGIPRQNLLGETNEQESDYLAKPDDLWSYELGAKGTSLDGRLRYDVALWAIDWSDFQALVTINSISDFGNSESDISAYGFEATLQYKPSVQFELDASVGYADSSLDDDAPSLGALKGEQSLYLPRWTGSLRGTYEFPLLGIDGRTTVGLRYVGSYSTAYRSGVPGCSCSLNFPVEDYVLLDGSVTFDKGRYGLTLYGTNLLDEAALTSARAEDVFGIQVAYGTSAKPRTIGAYLWMNF